MARFAISTARRGRNSVEAALRQRIREARNQQRRRMYPYVVDSELVTAYGICLHCNGAFEPDERNRTQIYCCERCRKRASMVRVHRRAKA